MQPFILRLFLCVACFYSISCNAIDPEKLWAVTHPFAALKLKRINAQCQIIYNDTSIKKNLDLFPNGGKLDAFRHVFFMSAFAQKIKTKKLRKLGKAHERKNYRQFLTEEKDQSDRHDSLGMVMDLSNNELAFNIGCQNKALSLTELKAVVLNELKAGKALIMKRNKAGNYLSCDDRFIDLTLYRNKWSTPKCLVNSNYVYMD